MPDVQPRLRPASVLRLLLLLSPSAALADWPSNPLVNVPICTAAGQQTTSVLTSDGSGGAIIAWQDARLGTANYDIYAQHVLAGGAVDSGWPVNGQALCTAVGNQTNPVLLSDGVGGALVAWQDRRSGTTGDVYAHHLLATGLPDPAWPADGRAICTAPENQFGISMVSDDAGGAILVWRDFRDSTMQGVYAQHLLANGQVDAGWPANGRVLLTQPNTFIRPIRIPAVSDGHGGAVVTWENFQGVGTADIYAQGVRADGTLDPAWPAAGRAVCAASDTQLNPKAVSDGAGGAIISWDDLRDGATTDIYAQRVRANGSVDPVWPSDGRLICAAAGNQQVPSIAPDGNGGALISWVDFRPGLASDIYAQHVLASGIVDPGWPVDGRAVCSAAGNQNAPSVTSDGSGGMLLAWQDSRTGTPDIYAHHVLSSGAIDPVWPADGRAVCTATGAQGGVLILADGSGGAIIAWDDQRSGGLNNDIYAQRVQANGQLGGTVVDVPREPTLAFTLDAVSPNPWRGGVLTLSYSLASSAAATVEVLDIAGRRVATQELAYQGPGQSSTRVEVGKRLTPGIYLLRLRQLGAARIRRLAVLE